MCSRYGEVNFNPALNNGQTPELLWTFPDGIDLLEVVTFTLKS